jgi:hypothetical protein
MVNFDPKSSAPVILVALETAPGSENSTMAQPGFDFMNFTLWTFP